MKLEALLDQNKEQIPISYGENLKLIYPTDIKEFPTYLISLARIYKSGSTCQAPDTSIKRKYICWSW